LSNRQTEYLTKDDAAKRSGRSVRRLLELASRGQLRKRIIRDAKNGNRALTLFHAGDIAALADGEAPHGALQISGPVRPIAALPQGEELAKAPRLWLTLAEAADYSGLPASYLLAQIGEKKLPALDVGVRPGGRWRISRHDLKAISAEVARTNRE